MKDKGYLVVVSGFAGTGKGTLMRLLLERYDDYVLSVSATTRAPRPGEQEGVHYFFKERAEFEEMIKNDQLLEYAEYVGNYYGTPKSFVREQLKNGKNVILEIEIQGALRIKKQFPEAILLFVVPPSARQLKERLEGRGTETADIIKKRLSRAVEEAEGISQYDYLLVNDELDECVKQMHEIISSAHYSTSRTADFINEMQRDLKNMLAEG